MRATRVRLLAGHSGIHSDAAYLLRGDGLLAGLAEFLDRLLVETKILLAANQNLGDIRAEVMYFRAPLSNSISKSESRVPRDAFIWNGLDSN